MCVCGQITKELHLDANFLSKEKIIWPSSLPEQRWDLCNVLRSSHVDLYIHFSKIFPKGPLHYINKWNFISFFFFLFLFFFKSRVRIWGRKKYPSFRRILVSKGILQQAIHKFTGWIFEILHLGCVSFNQPTSTVTTSYFY